MLPNIDDLTTGELLALRDAVNNTYYTRKAQDEADVEARRKQIGQAVESLNNLLGDSEAPANLTSIRGVRQFSEEQMGDNAGLALSLVFAGLEILTTTTRDMARVQSI